MPENLSFKQTLQMRQSYVGSSCRLHFEVAPLKIVRASRQFLYDDCGTEYLDCINNTSHVGHCHPHVVSAGQEQMARLMTSYGFLNDQMVEYAKRLIETLPKNLCVCYFVNSGSEANDMALRLARGFTKNNDVVVVDHGYHGNISNLVDVSPSRLKRHNLPKKDWVHIAPCPDTYRGIYREDTPNPGAQYADEVRKIIWKAKESGRSIAAFLSEPGPIAAGGIIMPPPKYLRYVYRYIREAGGVCIADEVQTGLGRTGEKFWAFQSHDVVPDIITMGKPLGNGHPLAVVVTTKEIAESVKEFSSTFGGNPVACAMGNAVLDVIRNEKLMPCAKNVGKCLLEGFRAILPKHPMMGDVRGQGMVVGVEIVMDKESRKPAKEAAEILIYKLKEDKIIIANDGPDKNVLIMTPPLCFNCDNARRVVQAVDKALWEIENEASRVGLTSQVRPEEVPLDILTAPEAGDSDKDVSFPSKRFREDDDDDDEFGSGSKRPRYEEMD